ncbi:hypothetical protein JCGZ_17078 [Jatropha curcas]|uniref:RNase H type-1 domain-containing protein n=1 Tax=Jatropha curcas TaxID=180498 RepID=A0A067LL99_JATCU|nr:hypothetical protein JCGZ_17078 [Jatropha curcas]
MLDSTKRRPVKVNYDVAVRTDATCGFGMVIRNSAGVVMASGLMRGPSFLSPKEAKITAMFFVISKAVELNFTTAVFESDCLPLVTSLKTRSMARSDLGTRILNCLLASRQFIASHITHIYKEWNVVAHSLAQLAFSIDLEEDIWTEKVPPSIIQFVIAHTIAFPQYISTSSPKKKKKKLFCLFYFIFILTGDVLAHVNFNRP